MATRLYPTTDDPVVLAKLIGVHPAHVVKAQALLAGGQETHEAALKPIVEAIGAYCDEGYALHVLLQELAPDVQKARQFLIFGWGRMRADREPCGHTSRAHEMRALLIQQGVTLPEGMLVEELCGLCWS